MENIQDEEYKLEDKALTTQEFTEKVFKENLDEVLLQNNLGKIAYTLDRAYISHLEDYTAYKFEQYCKEQGIEYETEKTKKFMAVRIDKFIINKDEKVIDCMKNVIGTFSNSLDSLSFVIQRKKDCVSLYFIFKKNKEEKREENQEDNNREYLKDHIMLLKSAIEGNFPGSSVEEIIKDDDIENKFRFLNEAVSIAVLSSIPSDKSENYISQGIEKLLNGVVPESDDKEYAIMMLAQSLTQEEIREVISGFEDMATAISPYSTHQFQIGKNDSETVGEMKSSTDTEGISHAITKIHSVNIGFNVGTEASNSESSTQNEAAKKVDGGVDKGNQTIDNVADSAKKGVDKKAKGFKKLFHQKNKSSKITDAAIDTGKNLTNVGIDIKKTKLKVWWYAVGTIVRGLVNVVSTVTGGNIVTSSITKALNLGMSGGYGYSWGKIDTTSISKALTDGKNHNVATGTSENSIYNYKSYQVSDLVQNLETTIKRLSESKATGLWKTAVYIFSSDSNTSKSVANYLRGLTQGDESYIEAPIVYEWNKSKHNDLFQEVKSYLTNFIHPIFVNGNDMQYNNISKDEIIAGAEEALRKSGIDDETIAEEVRKNVKAFKGVELIPVTTTTNISTTELAKLFALPTHSIPNLPVLECAEFGRTVFSYDNNNSMKYPVILGSIYHMHRAEKLPVLLNADSLCSHTFITGSTGSGKSNTVYQILKGIGKRDKKFLVIEPAKGEYKDVFGKDDDVKVYGTNPRLTELLRINPFSFDNKHIHILEHLDRLIEIFNVCWPMYAAMPAVLKEAVEKSYEDAGWNLTASENKYGVFYPTFADVTRNVRQIIDNSDYDVLNKGSYKGALVTRLKSLTNGINGLIFTTDELLPEKLFDENVIVDLSRVGSTETKALMMGLLVLKLQEYRMSKGGMNNELQHVTVLEEAHNLLKATSTEQHEDSGNLLGKSVEMLTNAIAEMRTYGEGFIIADQAPGLLDKAVIRNTNTKIIMRLPDLADRELVGKAANLNDHQIEELAKLPCGVAAVYQNEWVQPVLCKVDKYDVAQEKYKYEPQKNPPINNDILDRITVAEMLSRDESMDENTQLNGIKKTLSKIRIHDTTKVMIMRYLTETSPKPKFVKLAPIMAELFPKSYEAMIQSYKNDAMDYLQWNTDVNDAVIRELVGEECSENVRNSIIQAIVTQYLCLDLQQYDLYDSWAKQNIENKGVL